MRFGRSDIPLFLAGIFLPVPVLSMVYDVGDDQSYEQIGEVPWESLVAGDTVNIHYRLEDYHEKWVICRVGTSDEPIVVRGIPSPGGDLPVINGIGATTRAELNFWNEERGVIKIGGANSPADTMPAHIIIESLDIRSGRPPYTFTGRHGLTSYVDNCAAIYIEKGEHILIRGCILRDCGNGLFCGHQTTDLVVEANAIRENGIEGEIYEHNNYTEAFGILFQYNQFGPLRQGCGGNNLKDRSAGTIIRYNWIESGNRQLDLVDSDYASLFADSLYRRTFVYGNILVEPDGAGNSQILHYGGDSGHTERYRKGTLYLHHNTIISTRDGNTTLARLSTNEEVCDARNNIIYTTAPGNRLAMLAESGGELHLRGNWLKSGWVTSHGSTPGWVIDHGNLEGEDPGLRDLGAQDFELAPGSICIDTGVDLDEAIVAEHTPVMEYVRHAMARERPADGMIDVGAYEYAGEEAAPTPASLRENGVLAFPNPFQGRVSLRAPEDARVLITDVHGRIVFEGSGSAWEPDSRVPAGVFFVHPMPRGDHPAARIIYLRSR